MIAKLLTASALLLSAVTPSSAAAQTPAPAPRMGGVLKAAMIGEPPSLDMHWTTAVITQQIMWHVYETLYTYDRNFAPIPMLAEEHTVSDNSRRYTIALRRGVRFQTAFYEDVGRIKFGDYFGLQVIRRELRGFRPSPDMFFWNTWLVR